MLEPFSGTPSFAMMPVGTVDEGYRPTGPNQSRSSVQAPLGPVKPQLRPPAIGRIVSQDLFSMVVRLSSVWALIDLLLKDFHPATSCGTIEH